MRYRYSEWDGTQQIAPLDPDELLEMLADDLFEDPDLRRALERMMMRGGERPQGDRLQGLRDLLDQLRNRKQEQMNRFNLDSSMDQIAERLEDIVKQEREGIEKRLQDSSESGAPQEMQDLMKQVAGRKQQALDNLPENTGGMMQQLMDYEFMDENARQAFDELVNELRQKMLGQYFQGLQQNLQNLTPEDLKPLREMMRDLNQLLNKKLNGQDTQRDFDEFMQKHGGLFPDGINNVDDLIEHMKQQASQMQSLLKSMSEEQRQALQETIDALLRDDRLTWDMAQMAGLIEAITGEPLGRAFPFDGDTPLGLDEALQMVRQMSQYDDLERQIREAIRDMNTENIDDNLMRDLLGEEGKAALEELRRMTKILEEAGLIRDGSRSWELTSKAIRMLGERALKEIFQELRRDRSGDHDAHNKGMSAEVITETKPWEFGDNFFLDIGKTVSNAIFRSGGGTPVKLDVKDFEVYKSESLVTASTVIVLDMSMSMIRSGSFAEAKKVALALDTLMRSRYPRDYLELVVFSYFAMELKAGRLLQSDWQMYPRGTNIQEALNRARKLLAKRKATNRQIILITDGQPTMYTAPTGEVIRGWSPYEWPRYSPEAMQETLKEVQRCTRDQITINTFMMANDPSLVQFGKLMAQINKGRIFLTSPGHLGHYVLHDYLRNKSKVLAS